MSCLSKMSPPAIWPPHSSEQIFEAGIRTCCHAYLNDQTSGSQQNSLSLAGGWAGGGEPRNRHQDRPPIPASSGHRAVRRREHCVNADPGWKNASRAVFTVPCKAAQAPPNTQPLNKQGDSISEVELNSLKQFSKKKRKKKKKGQPTEAF